jgi:hypothetical protein
MMNNQDPINGWKSVPFSPNADQAVSAMSSSTLPADPDAATAATSFHTIFSFPKVLKLRVHKMRIHKFIITPQEAFARNR